MLWLSLIEESSDTVSWAVGTTYLYGLDFFFFKILLIYF